MLCALTIFSRLELLSLELSYSSTFQTNMISKVTFADSVFDVGDASGAGRQTDEPQLVGLRLAPGCDHVGKTGETTLNKQLGLLNT